MKTQITKIILLACISLGISCSKDDDEAPTEFYVKNIAYVQPATPSNAENITFGYDDQNRISNYTVEKASQTISRTILYDGNSLISQINETATSSTNQLQFAFSYSANKITSMSISSSASPLPSIINFAYNSTLKKYTGTESSSGNVVVEVDVDDANNIIEFDFNSETATITYTTNAGIFKNNTNCIPLFLNSLFSTANTKYATQFFSNKEIATLSNPFISLSATTVRNENNQIGNINFLSGSSTLFEITLTHERRNY